MKQVFYFSFFKEPEKKSRFVVLGRPIVRGMVHFYGNEK